MNESTIDKELRQLRELESSLQSLAKCIDSIRDERDRLRDENTRLQSEVQRLQLGITPDGIKVWVAMADSGYSNVPDYVIMASPDRKDIEECGYQVTDTGLLVNIQPCEG